MNDEDDVILPSPVNSSIHQHKRKRTISAAIYRYRFTPVRVKRRRIVSLTAQAGQMTGSGDSTRVYR